MFFINNKEEEFKLDSNKQEKLKRPNSQNSIQELERINDSILCKGSKKETDILDKKLANNILNQLKLENDDIFKQVNVQRSQFLKKQSPVLKDVYQQQKNYINQKQVNSRSKLDQRPPLDNNRNLLPSSQSKSTDIVSLMANRLTQLEFTNKDLKEQLTLKEEMLKKCENQLEIYKKKPIKNVQEAHDRKVEENRQLKEQIKEMEKFLLEYGLKWKGYSGKDGKHEGQLDVNGILKELKEKPMFNYNLPSQIDMSVISQRIKELNQIIRQEGVQQVYKDISGAHKFKQIDDIAIGFYKDGLVIKGFPFYSYNSNIASQILADILDGYFPYQLKKQYPDGVLLSIVDRIQLPFQESINNLKANYNIKDLSQVLEQQLVPKSVEQFLNNLPKQVIRDGKVFEIRADIEQVLNGNQKEKEQKIQKEFLESEIVVPTAYKLLMDRKELSEEQKRDLCVIKIKMEANVNKKRILILNIDKHDSIKEVFNLIDNYSDFQEQTELIQNFPRMRFNRDDQTLDQLGLYPNSVLILNKTKQ